MSSSDTQIPAYGRFGWSQSLIDKIALEEAHKPQRQQTPTDTNKEYKAALALVLAAHTKWRDTGGQEGVRLVFPPATNLHGADFRNVELCDDAPLGVVLQRAIQRREDEPSPGG